MENLKPLNFIKITNNLSLIFELDKNSFFI